VNELSEKLQSVISFQILYSIPIPNGQYEIKHSEEFVQIQIKRNQKNPEGWVFGGSGSVQFPFDKYGLSANSSVSIKIPRKLRMDNKGRKTLLMKTGPRDSSKELALSILNQFIEAVKYVTEEYWIEPIRYQDIFAYEINYWDGKNLLRGQKAFLDSSGSSISLSTGPAFNLTPKKKEFLVKVLHKELDVDPIKLLLLNSKDACIQENYKIAVIESVIALETVLSDLIMRKGQKRVISKKNLRKTIADVGLTGNLTTVLKLLIDDYDLDPIVQEKCKSAITLRNKIMHKGLVEVSSLEGEESLLNIERMINWMLSK